MKNIQKIIISSSVFMPVIAFAQQTFTGIMTAIRTIITTLLPILIAFAALLFIWGVVQFIASAGDEEKRNTGRQHMIWGIVGFAVIVGLWGLVNVVLTAFGVTAGGAAPVPPGI